MKIIKNAKTEPTEIVCKKCGSILSYTYEDIKRRDTTDFTSFLSWSLVETYVICPVCKEDIYLNTFKSSKKKNINEQGNN